MKTEAILSLWLALSLSSSTFAVETDRRECTYEVTPDSFKVKWTSFKTTDRIGVTGSFKDIRIEGPTRADNFENLLTGITVTIDSHSVDLNDSMKEKNLVGYFFDKLFDRNIVGRISSVNREEHSFVLTLSLNGEVRDVPMTYSLEGDGKIKAKGQIDLMDFQADGALRSLSEMCAELHKGPDGVSKTWPDIDIVLEAQLKSGC